MGVGCSCLSASAGNPAPSTHIEVLPALAGVPVACTLGERDLSARTEAFHALFQHLGSSTRLQAGFRWSFHNAPGVERRLRELARREHECCPFLTFVVSVQGDQVVWSTCGPAEAEAALDVFYRMPETPGLFHSVAPSARG